MSMSIAPKLTKSLENAPQPSSIPTSESLSCRPLSSAQSRSRSLPSTWTRILISPHISDDLHPKKVPASPFPRNAPTPFVARSWFVSKTAQDLLQASATANQMASVSVSTSWQISVFVSSSNAADWKLHISSSIKFPNSRRLSTFTQRRSKSRTSTTLGASTLKPLTFTPLTLR